MPSEVKNYEPLIRIEKKNEMAKSKATILRIASFVLAVVFGGIFILAAGYNPIDVYIKLVSGCFSSSMAVQSTVKIAIPLLINALGLTLAFKMKFWNIGAEGQMIMGAVFASYFALYQNNMPHYLLLIVAFIAGIIGGGLWGLIPAYFKAKFNTNETLLTLMLNYIALYIIIFLKDGPWKDPQARGFSKIATFHPNAYVDEVFGIQAGWIVAIILTVLVFVFLKYSKSGYQISVVGESQATARYAGMDVKKIIIKTMFISGAICGIAGMLQCMGTTKTLTEGIASGVGFTAIIVAWLSQLNPFVIVVITALFSILEKGSGVINIEFGISEYTSDVLQGIILFFIIATEFFVRYKFSLRKRGGTNNG